MYRLSPLNRVTTPIDQNHPSIGHSFPVKLQAVFSSDAFNGPSLQPHSVSPTQHPINPMKLFSHLFLLARATEAEVAKQAEQKVQKVIETVKIEESLKGESKKQVRIISEKAKSEIEKSLTDALANIEKYTKNVENYAETKKKELDKLNRKLTDRINGTIIFLGLLGAVILVVSPSLISSFALINTSKTEIGHLKSDIEDLQDEIKILRGN